MGNIFYITGIILAGYAGASDLGWYFIIVSSLIMTTGYAIIRAPQLHGNLQTYGAFALFKGLLFTTIMWVVVTTAIYFIGAIFS